MAKPFLKWAGGKTQLLAAITDNLPRAFTSYIEPFAGSGAVMFDIISTHPRLESVIINDINADLVNTYLNIQGHCEEMIPILAEMQDEYNNSDAEARDAIYYAMRDEYNNREASPLRMACLFIFLNRTCFNGLYRVNAHNVFNVPHGRYRMPRICDAQNLRAVAAVLNDVAVFNGDYDGLRPYVRPGTFVYLDPPYKPISETSSFNSYSAVRFDDEEQGRLKLFCDFIDGEGASFMLSNSDPRSKDPGNTFFDDLYADYHIQRIPAKRLINANAAGRGEVNELLITNY